MEFFNSAVEVLQTLVVALGGGLCVWGGINLLEGYGQDNPGSKQPSKPDSRGTRVMPIRATPPPATSCLTPCDLEPGLSCP